MFFDAYIIFLLQNRLTGDLSHYWESFYIHLIVYRMMETNTMFPISYPLPSVSPSHMYITYMRSDKILIYSL